MLVEVGQLATTLGAVRAAAAGTVDADVDVDWVCLEPAGVVRVGRAQLAGWPDSFELRIAVDDPGGVRTARRAAAEVIGGWQVRDGIIDDACLVVSELVTKAFTHGRSDAVLRVLQAAAGIRIEVVDEDTRLPTPMAPDWQSLSGRGLTLVAFLASLWGAEHTATGKVLWAEFDVGERRSP